jgi:hypothetical protein
VAEYIDAAQAMGSRFTLTPLPCGKIACIIELLCINITAELFLDCHVIVQEEMPWHVNHRHAVGCPDTGMLVDIDRYCGLHSHHS